jgi:hypothetical protein
MKIEIKNRKAIVFNIALTVLTLVTTLTLKVQAACQNTVPNPLNPDCNPGNVVTVGALTNRFIGVVPIVITIVTVVAIARGSLKIIMADDAEKRQAGFKSIINAALGAAVFYSIWLVLFLIEYFTGAELIPF